MKNGCEKMTNEKNQKNEKQVIFENCYTIGDMVNVLTKKFTNYTCGDYILEKALELVKENNKKIETFKEKLIKGN